MRFPARRFAIAVAVVALSSSAAAQGTPAGPPKGATAATAPLVLTLLKDVNGVGDKLVALAKAIPAEKYDWRPAAGVRSVREVFLHVASDNYLLPALAGTAAPAATGISVRDFQSVDRFEKRPLVRDSVIAELERSFTHLYDTMGKSGPADLSRELSLFGQKTALGDLWVTTTTHLHEHLGQQIAYARSNGVKPPWSR